MSTLIEIRNLSKVYERGVQKVEALHHVNLDIVKGDFLALMGPSGSGKTTLLNLIGGLDSPTDGSITVARVILFLSLAAVLGFGIVKPLMRLNRRSVARRAEEAFPQFEERLLTFAERNDGVHSDPFLELLAEDALPVAADS